MGYPRPTIVRISAYILKFCRNDLKNKVNKHNLEKDVTMSNYDLSEGFRGHNICFVEHFLQKKMLKNSRFLKIAQKSA